MSGGPCFNKYFAKSVAQPPAQGVTLGNSVMLLGLVTGHFDDAEPLVGVPEEFGSQLSSRVNTGIGIITPAWRITELIDGVAQDAAQQRRQRLGGHQSLRDRRGVRPVYASGELIVVGRRSRYGSWRRSAASSRTMCSMLLAS